MTIKTVSLDRTVCFLLKNDTEEEILASKYVFNKVTHIINSSECEYNREVNFAAYYLAQYLSEASMGNGYFKTTIAMQNYIGDLYDKTDYVQEYLISDQYIILFLEYVHTSLYECTIFDMLSEICNGFKEKVKLIGTPSDGFTSYFCKFVRACSKMYIGKFDMTPLYTVKNEELLNLLSSVLFDRQNGKEALHTLEKYLKPTRFKVRFKRTDDMIKYYKSQDPSTFIECGKDYIVQQYIDTGQLVHASDYGKVGII